MANKRPIFHTLKDFLSTLEREGELKRITVPVDPYLEASAIAIRSMLEGGPALLFENVKGSNVPLAMNILSSDRRVELSLGAHPGELGEKLIHLVEQVMPPKPKQIWQAASPLFNRIIGARISRKSSDVYTQSNINTDPDLGKLPILQTWPDDGGKFVTLPQVFTYDPITKKRNVGMYRVHVFGKEETGIHWQIQKGGGFHYRQAEQQNKPLEIAIAVGTDPALLLATIAPLPEGIDEVMFAGFLRGQATQMSRGKTINIDIPANAEFVLEGVVPPQERRREGPFGDHFGHYSHAGMFPVFKIRAITSARSPIFAATVVGKPPMEDKWLGDATQLILGPLAKLTHPEVKDVWAFYESGFHNLLGVATQQRYAKEAMKTALSIATDGQLSLTKCAIIVNSEVNNRDFRALLRAIKQHFDPHYDILIVPNVAMDTLDFTSYTMNLGSKMLIDATEKFRATASGGAYPERTPSPYFELTGKETVDARTIDTRIIDSRVFDDVLLVVKVEGPHKASENAAIHLENEIQVPQKTIGREVIERLVAEENLPKLPEGVKIIAAVSDDVDLGSDMEVIWGIFTRFDAARDVMFTKSVLVGVTAVHQGVMGIDATWKPGYPNPCELPAEIPQLVNDRWKEYGFR